MRFAGGWILVLFLATVSGVSQEHSKNSDDALEFLKHPSSLTLGLGRRVLEPNETPDVHEKPFEEGKRVFFRVLLTNMSLQPVSVVISNPYFQNRPKLFKRGREIAYRKDVRKIVEGAEKERVFDRNVLMRLEPNVPTVIGYLDLGEWYASLKPGDYQLTNSYRFVPEGEWLDSEVVTFTVGSGESGR